MHLFEIRQTLQETSFKQDIYYTSRIIRNLLEYAETTDDINYTDFVYISTLTSKAKTLLDKAYTILEFSNKGV